MDGGRSGIRTHEPLAGLTVFKTDGAASLAGTTRLKCALTWDSSSEDSPSIPGLFPAKCAPNVTHIGPSGRWHQVPEGTVKDGDEVNQVIAVGPRGVVKPTFEASQLQASAPFAQLRRASFRVVRSRESPQLRRADPSPVSEPGPNALLTSMNPVNTPRAAAWASAAGGSARRRRRRGAATRPLPRPAAGPKIQVRS